MEGKQIEEDTAARKKASRVVVIFWVKKKL